MTPRAAALAVVGSTVLWGVLLQPMLARTQSGDDTRGPVARVALPAGVVWETNYDDPSMSTTSKSPA